MKNLILFIAILLIACNDIQTQTIHKNLLLLANDSSAYYLAIKPKTENIKGALILIGGFGEIAENVFQETKIDELAYDQQWLTVVISMGQKMYADSSVVEKLNALMRQVIDKYGVNKENFVLGGYSIGGAIAIRYVEYCKKDPDQFPIAPKGVFAVDAPIDLIDLWNYFEREMTKKYSPVGVEEAKQASAIMLQEIGTPVTNLQQYKTLSPFYRNDPAEGNEKYLRTTPVRVYHDMDINWYLKNRRRSAYDCNFLNTSEMINRLLLMGNEQAEFMVGKTGYRSNGSRHPHSWSIVDEPDLLEWADQILAQ